MDDTEAKPRRRTRASRLSALPGADPMAAAMQEETANTADDLSQALSALSTVSMSGVKVIVFKVPPKGEWEHVKQLQPPFNVNDLINELELNYGPGKYCVRVYADDRIKTNKFIAIAAPKTANNGVLGVSALGGSPDILSFLSLLMNRKGEDGSKDLIALMMSQQQQSAQQMMTMQMESTRMMVQMMTAMMANRSNPAEDFARMGMLMKDLRSPENGMKETLEILAAAKDIVGGGEGSGGFMGMAEKMMPLLAGMASAGQQGAGQAGGQVQPMAALPAPVTRAPPPPVAGAASAAIPPANDQAAPVTSAGAHPILDLVKPEIEFFMKRSHDPELAADAIADVLRANGITREQLFAFGMEIQGTDGDYVGRLLALGLDVSQHTEWFAATLAILAELDWTGDDDDHVDDAVDGAGGKIGSGPDAGPDASASPGRRPANPRPKQGGAAH